MHLRRPRLVGRLRDATKHPVTVVTGPAGSGKTVLVAQWADQHDGPPIAMVTIHHNDSWPTVAAHIDSELPTTEDAILVLDGIDTSPDERLATELVALLQRAPKSLHLVLVSRSRALPVLDELHGRTDVAFVNAADLRFTANEARQLVRSISAVKLGDDQVALLHARTEGLAAGLEIAAVGVRDALDPASYIETFGGDEKHLAAFLFDEVLARQSASVRAFLVRTSVLDRLNGALCDAVTGGIEGGVTLRRLERAGVFTQRLSGSREWFAYHSLFRGLLRGELRRGEYGDERALHVRAGVWCAAHDDPTAAARHFSQAEDWDRLVELADAYGRRMYECGRAGEVLHWLSELPVPEGRRPYVAIRRAYLHTMVSESQQATQVVHDLRLGELSTGEKVAIDALRAGWAFFDASPESAIEAADDALGALQDIELDAIPDIFGMTTPASLAMIAASSRARALWYLGDVDTARRVLTAGIKQPQVYSPWLLRTLSALAILEAWSGNLRLARMQAGRALALADGAGLSHHPAMLDTRLALAHVYRERGNQQQATQLLDEVDEIAAGSRRPFTMAILAMERARWHLSEGQPADGLATLARFRDECELSPPALIEAHLRAAEASLVIAVGDIDRAESIVASAACALICPDLAAAAVQAAVARHDLVVATERLASWPVDGMPRRHRLLRDLWTAVLDFERGDRRRAIQIASGIVDAAAREGDVRVFLDCGRPVERLFRALVHAAPLPYAERLVRLAQQSQDPAKGTVLGLSKRELEVARYLPTPLSSAEIAERLYISLNTLKTHLRTIYGKLGATNRREAIERAEELGIA